MALEDQLIGTLEGKEREGQKRTEKLCDVFRRIVCTGKIRPEERMNLNAG